MVQHDALHAHYAEKQTVDTYIELAKQTDRWPCQSVRLKQDA